MYLSCIIKLFKNSNVILDLKFILRFFWLQVFFLLEDTKWLFLPLSQSLVTAIVLSSSSPNPSFTGSTINTHTHYSHPQWAYFSHAKFISFSTPLTYQPFPWQHRGPRAPTIATKILYIWWKTNSLVCFWNLKNNLKKCL